MNDAGLVGLLQFLKQFVENEGGFLMVELQFPEHNGFLLWKNGQGAELGGIGVALVITAILGPLDGVVEFVHDVILSFEFLGFLNEISLYYLTLSRVLVLNQIDLP